MGELIKLALENNDVSMFLGGAVVAILGAGVTAGRYWAKYDCERFKLLLENKHKSTITIIENTNTTTLANLAVAQESKLSSLLSEHKSAIANIENTNTTTLANLAAAHDEAIKALQAETIPLVCAIRNNKHNSDIEFGRANGVFMAVPPPKIQTRFKQGISVFCYCRYFDVAAKSCIITNQPCKLLGISLSQNQ
jgi:hypothetical protein